jgi:hypothetical protein
VTERFYELAGIRYRFLFPRKCPWDSVRKLTDYTAEPGPWDVECIFSTPEELSAPEGQLCYHIASTQVFRTGDEEISYHGSVATSLSGAYLRIHRRGNQSLVQLKASSFPKGITDDVILICMELVHQVTAAGGFLLHASWICFRDKAILFTGPSGMGKSTQAALWEQYRGAELINGDRAAIFPTISGAEVRGIPYCGSSGVNKNRTMPLGAVVCLSQAAENSLTRLSGLQAFRRLWEGCSVNLWNGADIAQGTQSVVDTVSAVPVFHLACTPDERAVQILEKEGIF